MLPERRFSLPPTSTSSDNEQNVWDEGALSPAKFPSCASVLAGLYKGLLSEIKQQSRQKLAGWSGGAQGGAGRAPRGRFRVIVKFGTGQSIAPPKSPPRLLSPLGGRTWRQEALQRNAILNEALTFGERAGIRLTRALGGSNQTTPRIPKAGPEERAATLARAVRAGSPAPHLTQSGHTPGSRGRRQPTRPRAPQEPRSGKGRAGVPGGQRAAPS